MNRRYDQSGDVTRIGRQMEEFPVESTTVVCRNQNYNNCSQTGRNNMGLQRGGAGMVKAAHAILAGVAIRSKLVVTY